MSTPALQARGESTHTTADAILRVWPLRRLGPRHPSRCPSADAPSLAQGRCAAANDAPAQETDEVEELDLGAAVTAGAGGTGQKCHEPAARRLTRDSVSIRNFDRSQLESCGIPFGLSTGKGALACTQTPRKVFNGVCSMMQMDGRVAVVCQ